MAAPCKLPSSKLGKAIQQMSVRLKQHSITVHGAIATPDSVNTPKRWKPRKPHNTDRFNSHHGGKAAYPVATALSPCSDTTMRASIQGGDHGASRFRGECSLNASRRSPRRWQRRQDVSALE